MSVNCCLALLRRFRFLPPYSLPQICRNILHCFNCEALITVISGLISLINNANLKYH